MRKSDILYLGLYYILKTIFKILPKKSIKILANLIATTSFKLNKKHRKIIDTNLSMCFPQKDKKERDEISLNIYKSFAKFGFDFLANENIDKEQLEKKVTVENFDDFKRISFCGRKLIFTTAHYGNWELLPSFYSALFKKISIVMRTLDSNVMDKIVSKNRSKFDVELIDKKGGAKAMLKALRDDRVLGILSDQDVSDNEGMYSMLAQIGISASSADTTKLSIDEKKLDEALSQNFDSVKLLLSDGYTSKTDNGLFDKLLADINSVLDVESGYFSQKSTSLQSQITTVNDRIERANTTLANYEARITKQFNAMDSTISSLSAQLSAFQSYLG